VASPHQESEGLNTESAIWAFDGLVSIAKRRHGIIEQNLGNLTPVLGELFLRLCHGVLDDGITLVYLIVYPMSVGAIDQPQEG
jgi:hypothetical protein